MASFQGVPPCCCRTHSYLRHQAVIDSPASTRLWTPNCATRRHAHLHWCEAVNPARDGYCVDSPNNGHSNDLSVENFWDCSRGGGRCPTVRLSVFVFVHQVPHKSARMARLQAAARNIAMPLHNRGWNVVLCYTARHDAMSQQQQQLQSRSNQDSQPRPQPQRR